MIKTFTGPMFSGKTTALLSTYFKMWNKKNICFVCGNGLIKRVSE